MSLTLLCSQPCCRKRRACARNFPSVRALLHLHLRCARPRDVAEVFTAQAGAYITHTHIHTRTCARTNTAWHALNMSEFLHYPIQNDERYMRDAVKAPASAGRAHARISHVLNGYTPVWAPVSSGRARAHSFCVCARAHTQSSSFSMSMFLSLSLPLSTCLCAYCANCEWRRHFVWLCDLTRCHTTRCRTAKCFM